MTVNSTLPVAGPFAGNGLNKDFPYAFRVGDIDYFVVEVTIGDEAPEYFYDNFTATGIGEDEGGVLTYPTTGDAVQAGATIRVLRNVPLEQPYRIGNQGSFRPEVHEDALDNLAMQVQQLAAGGIGTAAGDSAQAAAASAAAAAASAATAVAASSGVSAWADLAAAYANYPEDQLVEAPDKFSAFHWAEKAKDFAGGGAYGDVFGPAGPVVDGHAVVFNATTGKLIKSAGAAPSLAGHTHDDRYYTESEVNALISGMLTTAAINAGGGVQGYSAQLAALAALSGTAFGRSLITLADAAALRSTAVAATKTQTDEALPIFIRTLAAETLEDIFAYMPHAGILTSLRMKIRSGTSVAVRLRKNGADWDGAARTVTTTLQNFNASLPLTWAAGDRIGATFSSLTGSPVDLSIMGTYTRVYA